MRVLIVDDEVALLHLLRLVLQEEYLVDTATNINEAKEYLRGYLYQVMVLDRTFDHEDRMGEMIGYAQRLPHPPAILILSALGGVDERVEGFARGADDYLEKPFHTKELRARLRALVRRNSFQGGKWGPWRIDLVHQHLYKEDQPIALSKREHTLLFHLLQRYPSIVSREELLDTLYADPTHVTSNAIDELIARLRRKIDPDLILTIKTRGYTIAPALFA